MKSPCVQRGYQHPRRSLRLSLFLITNKKLQSSRGPSSGPRLLYPALPSVPKKHPDVSPPLSHISPRKASSHVQTFHRLVLAQAGASRTSSREEPASPPPHQEANRTSPKTERPKTNRPDRASSFESDGTAVPELKHHVIFPRCKDRKNTDRIYTELVSIFGAARILQTGGQNIDVVFWSVDTTDEELATLREGLEANGVSGTLAMLSGMVFTPMAAANPHAVRSRFPFCFYS